MLVLWEHHMGSVDLYPKVPQYKVYKPHTEGPKYFYFFLWHLGAANSWHL